MAFATITFTTCSNSASDVNHEAMSL